jgi:XisI protein
LQPRRFETLTVFSFPGSISRFWFKSTISAIGTETAILLQSRFAIAQALTDRGVPASDIVLIFHAPFKRQFSGYALTSASRKLSAAAHLNRDRVIAIRLFAHPPQPTKLTNPTRLPFARCLRNMNHRLDRAEFALY